MKNEERNTGLDLLRILAMFMIIVGHAIAHGNAGDAATGINSVLVTTINTISTPAVNVFVLISGYFLYESTFRFKKLFLLWSQVFFYSIGIYLIVTIAGGNHFSPVDLIKYCLPVSFNRYWFFSTYIYMYLLSPFVNILLRNMSKEQHQLIIGAGFILLVLVSSVPGISVMNPQGGNGVLWFIMLYITGAYLRRFPFQKKCSLHAITFILCIGFAVASKYLIRSISFKLGFGGIGDARFSTYDSFPIYFASISVFNLFASSGFSIKNMRMKRIMTLISADVFGVYLLHEHNLVRPLLWQVANLESNNTVLLIPQILGVSLIVYVIAAIIDRLTWQNVQKGLSKVNMPKLLQRIENFLNT